MAQYCRYCSWFVTGNGNYCEKRQIEPSDDYAKRTNHCKDFDLNPVDAFGNGKEYQPRKTKRNDGKQITILELLKEAAQL